LRARKLVSAAPPDMKGMQITMDIRAYRDRPPLKETGRGLSSAQRSQGHAPKGTAQALWDYLLGQATASKGG
jgi:hypothetical protein